MFRVLLLRIQACDLGFGLPCHLGVGFRFVTGASQYVLNYSTYRILTTKLVNQKRNYNGYYWVLVKGLNLRYHKKESTLFAIDPDYGNLI